MSALRILIADDHEIVRHGIRALLGQSSWMGSVRGGYGRTAAPAVEKARELRPDIVLLDVGMPNLEWPGWPLAKFSISSPRHACFDPHRARVRSRS